MEREYALVSSIIIFVIFTLITYYGAKVTLWSSCIFGLFVALILLNLFYPVSSATTDNANFTLVIYAAFQIIGVILLAVYITLKSLGDVRYENKNDVIIYH